MTLDLSTFLTSLGLSLSFLTCKTEKIGHPLRGIVCIKREIQVFCFTTNYFLKITVKYT